MAPFRKKRKGDIREMIPDRTQNQGPTKWCIVVQTNNLCLAVRLTMIRIESSSAKFIIIIIFFFGVGGGGGAGKDCAGRETTLHIRCPLPCCVFVVAMCGVSA